jgi:hypothetical protein
MQLPQRVWRSHTRASFLGESDLPAFGYNLGDTAIEATKLPMHPETTISGAPSPHQAVTRTAI